MSERMSCDAAVVGGGMVGLSAALALQSAGLKVCIVDALPVEARASEAFDGRASAIAYTSWRMFGALGVAERLKGKVQRIEEILVSDGRAPDGLRPGGPGRFMLHFDAEELESPDNEPLGYMAENRHLRQALIAQIEASEAITARAPARVVDVERGDPHARLHLDDGTVTETPLVVAADGRNSLMRRRAGIRAQGWAYRQSAVVATAHHEKAHGGVAHEYFLPSGPFAILPMTENRASLVWTERPRAARALMALGEDAFNEELRRRFGDFLGSVEASGPRWSYPLGVQVAERYYDHRLALVGDAAHAIHPIAGQGFNLGLRDCAALADVVAESASAGLDVGEEVCLQRYERWRKFDNTMLAAATDGFNRLFANDVGPVRRLRDLGMALTGQVGPARRFFARHAGGDTGETPHLMRGESPL